MSSKSRVKQVLIVDDHAPSRQVLEELLQTLNVETASVPSGVKALELAGRQHFDLVLLDVEMPSMNGREVCRRLRADPRTADVPVVMVTGRGDRQSMLSGLAAGADDYLAKPLDPSVALSKVGNLLSRNRFGELVEERSIAQRVREKAGDGFITVDETGRIVQLNEKGSELLFFSEDGTDGRGALFWPRIERFYVAARDRESFECGDEVRETIVNTDSCYVYKDSGSSSLFWLDIKEILEADELLNRCSVYRLREVTEKVRFGVSLFKLHRAVSHKLQTPVHGFLSSLELLRSLEPGKMQAKDLERLLGLAISSARRLADSVDSVVEFAAASEQVCDGEGMLLAELRSVVEDVASRAGINVVEWKENGLDPLVRLGLDRRFIEVIVKEILDNSVKFHPTHSPSLEVIGEWREAAVALSIRDNNSLCLGESRGDLADPFFQNEELFTGEVPGMGLGLAKVAEVLKLVGGRCRFGYVPGQMGFEVYLEIPVERTCVEPIKS